MPLFLRPSEMQASSMPNAPLSYPTSKPPAAIHAPRATASILQRSSAHKLKIKTEAGSSGSFDAFLHMPTEYSPRGRRVGAILLSGASGGVTGPSGMYPGIADALAGLPAGQAIPTLRMDFRHPARTTQCVHDLHAAIDWLARHPELALTHFVLVGWSFGGAPAFTVGGADRRVLGVATLGSQTAETDGIRQLAPTPVLLLHGTGDRTLPHRCSERLYDMYGKWQGERTLRLFEGDNHALTRHAKEAAEEIKRFIIRVAGVAYDEDVQAVIEVDLGPTKFEDKVEMMKKGGDLAEPERIE
jgi:dienelactone hydrolase